MMKRALFIDRDGTLIAEPADEQVDSLQKLEFLPGVFRNLYRIRQYFDFELVIVSNQDGLGTAAYPLRNYTMVQDKMLKAFSNEGIMFDDIFIDRSRASEKKPTRKPGTGMLTKYLQGGYDLAGSYVIGDRLTDIELAKNLGAKGILIGDRKRAAEVKKKGLSRHCSLIAKSWDEISDFLFSSGRSGSVLRQTEETAVSVSVALDGKGKASVSTGLGFFNHMLEQIAKHSGISVEIKTKGDLQVDEHHSIEDTAIALGEALLTALGNKRGTGRYGFVLPMDDSLAQVAIDLGGRPWLVWEVSFLREKIGDMPTEMFYHFFKSFADAARCNINIKATGDNEHHKAEAIFKAVGRALKPATAIDPLNNALPSTKGLI